MASTAVEAMKAGAFHFLSKPFAPDDLRTVITRALEKRRLNLENAITLGLLPDIAMEKFHYLGNASLKGTRLALLSKESRTLQHATAGRMTYIDLSGFPGYMDQYTAALFLPHTDRSLFPNVRKIVE
jgi:uncharacterized 2Fe-2S/4Fe-4S cluster protein (DUF4445 family)